ncbi:hypothetical protein OGAPHI_006278 [Ogataea philodendri]|uniref:Uncharacterized protein n=1 Tax=Ogataea philodendri TaxID=1378263 RepID=A0A9P8NZJ5_9ASCO|nr:uncharacterized protein OGAPHI_006278 [Ogataea philodendri]KAH3662097.1 hypothetical protein OGAPHI_006278 [Ogataea philodendri]
MQGQCIQVIVQLKRARPHSENQIQWCKGVRETSEPLQVDAVLFDVEVEEFQNQNDPAHDRYGVHHWRVNKPQICGGPARPNPSLVSRPHILGCLIEKCPFGNYLAARDHFLGTCIERIPSLSENPQFNLHLKSRPAPAPAARPYWLWNTNKPNSGVFINGSQVEVVERLNKTKIVSNELDQDIQEASDSALTSDFFKDEERARKDDSRALLELNRESEKLRQKFFQMKKLFVENGSPSPAEQVPDSSIVSKTFGSGERSSSPVAPKEEMSLQLEFATWKQIYDSEVMDKSKDSFSNRDDAIKHLDDLLSVDSSRWSSEEEEAEEDVVEKTWPKKLMKPKKSKTRKVRTKSRKGPDPGLAAKNVRYSSNLFRAQN